MASYKYSKYLQPSNHSAFDAIHSAGHLAPYSGIYRCEGCGREVVSTSGKHLPPQNHHQHSYAQGNIRWRLVVTDAKI
jgi:hypothetical protein